MKSKTVLLLKVLAICLLSMAAALEAAPVKISFLYDENALKQTTDFLATNGCDSDSVNSFVAAVR